MFINLRHPYAVIVAACIVMTFMPGAAGADEAAKTEKTKLLLSAREVEELVDAADQSAVILLDIQERDAFSKAHLPGARWIDVASWKAAAMANSGDGLTNQQRWSELGSELGLARDGRIVVYGGALPNAARVWWLLKYLGCQHVSLMDGGIDVWRKQKLPITDEPAEFKTTKFQPAFQKQRLARIDHVKQAVQDGSLFVFDTRSKSEFAAGRVPGAAHLEWVRLLTDDGTFKSAAELRRMFQALNLGPQHTAVTYCRSGGRASVEAFALELAGYKNVQNYFCSWQEYSSDEDAPVEK
ncbi:putative thiosulfate sulfurtransferase [Symmachiella macrocystis]|uniref:Putative thiosulfate sulfurtransferase n=1 Tax=Symmachiella macrocystis TaxID=2527985 RepID=A0A5C6B7V0_9PLAN|nr:sulfurtransferase [Symmachiella macrocystis]TWU07376.1 putative thiosulfate sulfurtransferase [Symmachiella macrocystis]